MRCDDFERQDTTERYLLEQLTDVERDEFEQHYLECESCFARLQTNLALQTELRLRPAPATETSPAWFRLPIWAPAFAVLLLLVGLGIWWRARTATEQTLMSSSQSPTPPAAVPLPTSSSAAPQLEQLAQIAPPPYVAVALRGPEDQGGEVFREAMQHYSKGEYEEAIAGLRAAALASPKTPAISFYLGASYLLTHQVESGIDALGKTISLGDTAFSESAHFLLAKGYLAEGKVPAATDELRATIRLRGAKEEEARDILGELQK
jgi:hypothetical protein